MPMPAQLELDDSIRQVEIEGVIYFSVIDLFRTRTPLSKHIHKQWERARRYVKRQNFDIDSQLQWYQFEGQGQRETPMISRYTWDTFVAILGSAHFSSNKQQDHEVSELHPLVCALFESKNWTIQHHLELASGKIVDILAQRHSEFLVIECKRNLRGHDTFTAIGQVLCYCVEFGQRAKPVIATYRGQVDLYSLENCAKLGIQVLEVED